VQTDTELLNALSSGAIDAATVKLVQAQEILKKDNTFEIVLFMSIPKGMISVSESAGNIDVLLMRKSIAKKDPQKVATLLNGWDSTVAYIDIHPEQTVEFFSKQLNIEPNSVNSQISLNRWGTTELNKEISLDLAEK
jgi:ABC-type nitrate/sulfonate/bicarbonate transport system substrate-binding protein